MEWKKVKLGEVCDYVKDKVETSAFPLSAYISTENMLPNKGGIVLSSSVPDGKATAYRQNDVLISNIRPYFKKIWYALHDGSCSNDVLCFRANDDVDSLFLYLSLSQDAFFEYVMSGANGSKMPRGDRQHIMQYEFSLPPLPTQRRIASILSSLDAQIENNNRINRNLEAQAQALFKSWFVDFAPWGGKMPDGWREGKLGEMCTFKRGKNLLSKDAINEGVPVVAGGMEPACYHNVANTGAPVITISGSGANAGFMRMYHIPVWASDCSFIDDTCTNFYFVYCFLACNERLLRHAQTGAVQPHVKPSDIHDFNVIIPSNNVVRDFQSKVKSLFINIGNNTSTNLRLAALRDTLLPKLMKGEIEVSKS